MHLREKDDQYEEEDDDVVQEIDSNDVLVDSQEIFNFQNWKTLYYQLIIWIFNDCLNLKLEQQICFIQTEGFYRSPYWSSPCHGETAAKILFN